MYRGSRKIGIAPPETEFPIDESSINATREVSDIGSMQQTDESSQETRALTVAINNTQDTSNEGPCEVSRIPSLEGIPSVMIGLGPETAASNIQGVARGKAARNKVRNMRRVSQATGLESLNLKNAEGMEIYEEVERVLGTSSLEANQPTDLVTADKTDVCGVTQELPPELDEKNAAATNIQRVARGKAAREKVEPRRQSLMTENQNNIAEAEDTITAWAHDIKSVNKPSQHYDVKHTLKDIHGVASDPDMAASDIQRVIRGKSARNKVANMRECENNIISVGMPERENDFKVEASNKTCLREKSTCLDAPIGL